VQHAIDPNGAGPLELADEPVAERVAPAVLARHNLLLANDAHSCSAAIGCTRWRYLLQT
jgi:hypothetical protein